MIIRFPWKSITVSEERYIQKITHDLSASGRKDLCDMVFLCRLHGEQSFVGINELDGIYLAEKNGIYYRVYLVEDFVRLQKSDVGINPASIAMVGDEQSAQSMIDDSVEMERELEKWNCVPPCTGPAIDAA